MRFVRFVIASIVLFGFSAIGMAQTVPDADTRFRPPENVSEMTENGWLLPIGLEGPWQFSGMGYSRSDAVAAQQQLKAIFAEQATSTDTSIFQSYFGFFDVTYARIWLTRKSGYVFIYFNKCIHNIDALSYGDIVVTDATIELIPKGGTPFLATPDRNDYLPINLISKKLVRVRCGSGERIVPEDDLADFCRWASGRWVSENQYPEFRHLESLSRDRRGQASGPSYPILPAAFSHLALDPIRGRVVSVGKPVFQPERKKKVIGDDGKKEWQTIGERFVVTVTCEVDLPNEPLPGMCLRLCQPGSTSVLKVVRVSGHTVTCEFEPSYGDVPKGWDDKTVKEKLEWMAHFQPFKVGLPVSTSEFDVPAEDESPAAKTDSK